MSKEKRKKMRVRTIIVATLAAALALVAAAPAHATQPINTFEVSTSSTQAGDHPDLGAFISLDAPSQPEAVKNVIVNMPEGVFGNPGAISKCSSVQFALNQCPIGSQAGIMTVRATYAKNPHYVLGTAPLYNMVTRSENESALFAFVAPTVNIPVMMPIAVRTASDYGLRMTVAGITQQIPVEFVQFTVWGFPADAVHDAERFGVGAPDAPAGCPGELGVTEECNVPHRAAITVHPLTDNPTVCTGEPLTVELDVQTYEDPDNTSHAEGDYPPTTGCEKEIFNPVLNVEVTTDETDSASGMDLQLKAPQFLSYATSPSTIRAATLTLPEELSINPDAADGQTSCSDAQANFGTEGVANCPDTSKIGIFDIRTVALDGPLTGSLYIGEPQPGNQYRLFMVASGFGINAKLVADVHPDPETGQVTIVVENLPQVPFEEFNLHLFASQRGLVATPTHCTVYQTNSTFYPWNDKLAPQSSKPTFGLTSGPGGTGCPNVIRPFEPSLAAGTSNPKAKAFSDFTLKLDRDDGDQFLGDLGFTMPPGLTASLRGITYCSDALIATAAETLGRIEQSSPSCPESSRIGTTNVAAGPGTHPFHAVGRMYLAGPFKGAPLSVAAITPALAGPFDYGTVVVRVAIHVDPSDAHVVALSDTVPKIIGGIPIRMRSIQVNIDKSNFMINPTNCNPFSVASKGIGDQGTVADFSSFFQVVNCGDLPFKPRMTMKQLGGKKAAARSKNPGVQFDLRTRGGDANIKSVAVTLPKAFAIDQRHLGNICSKAQLAAERCAGRQAIGQVTTTTPLLDQPLSGPAYAVSGFGKLPHVVFILDGQVTIMPEAESSSVRGRLKTVVPVVPDAPIGHFRLKLFGGSKGYLVNTRNLCASPVVTTVEYIGQNDKTISERVKAKAPCGASEPRRKRQR
jgi:hypothetical protein